MATPTGHRFADKIVIVTGAAQGIGRATVERLTAEGATVACLDRNLDGATSAAEEAVAAGAAAFGVECDVSDEASVASAIGHVIERCGKLDVLVNMAGILSATHTHNETLENWNRIIAVNLTGTFLMCRDSMPHLIETKGNIVNAASTSSLSGHPWFAAYGASKGGVLMLTNSLAMEYAKRGVRVNSVAPGGIETAMLSVDLPEDIDFKMLERMMPLDRFRGPETVASTIAFLASEDAAHVNGEYVRVDGGTLA